MINILTTLMTADDLTDALRDPPAKPLLPPLGDAFWARLLSRPHGRTFLSALRPLAEAEAEMPLPPLTDALYAEFHGNGNRRRFEAVYFMRRRILARALFCSLADGPASPLVASTLDKLDGIFSEDSWELPAHVSRPDGRDPYVVGLFAAETAHLVAQCVCLLGDTLPPALLGAIRERLTDQVFDNYLANAANWWWTESTGNWNAVCHQGILGAALLTAEDPRMPARLLAAAAPRLARFPTGFTADGGCTEGPLYWAYGFGWFMALNEQLEWRSNGRLSLVAGHEERFRAISRFGVVASLSGGRLVNFADSQDAPIEMHAPLLAYAGERLDDPACKVQAQGMYRDLIRCGLDPESSRCDVFYLEHLLRHCPEPTEEGWTSRPCRVDVLPELGILVARGADEQGRYLEFAAKGGHNGEHHNHNDCGTYLLHLDGVPSVMELGRPEYTRETFGPRRYELNAIRSRGHSVPVINGCEQVAGTEHAARILHVAHDAETVEWELDLTACYPPEAECRSCIRRLCFDRRAGSLKVEDRFELDAIADVETAVILPDTDAPLVCTEPGGGTMLAETETLSYRNAHNRETTVRRLVLKPKAPSRRVCLTYTVRPAQARGKVLFT